MPLKLTDINISNKHNKLENPNWRKADQLAIYKHNWEVEQGSTKKQIQLSGQSRTCTSDAQDFKSDALSTWMPLPLFYVNVLNSTFAIGGGEGGVLI